LATRLISGEISATQFAIPSPQVIKGIWIFHSAFGQTLANLVPAVLILGVDRLDSRPTGGNGDHQGALRLDFL
jgi:hypothetical protein